MLRSGKKYQCSLTLFLKAILGRFINTIVVKGCGDKNVQNWKLDLAKKGMERILKPYQQVIIDTLLEAKKALGSGAVWQAVLDQGVQISRASVIFYLNFLVDDGLCTFDDATGKGGHHRLYRIGSDDWDGVKYHLAVRFIAGLGKALALDMAPALSMVKA